MMELGDNIISIRRLRNQFGAQVVHDNLDLDVRKGEVLGIVGGSGTGKSVLLRTIIGLNAPRAGEIKVFGQDLSKLSDDERREYETRWGVLFQDGALFSSLTVGQNIQVPLKEHLKLPQRMIRRASPGKRVAAYATAEGSLSKASNRPSGPNRSSTAACIKASKSSLPFRRRAP